MAPSPSGTTAAPRIASVSSTSAATTRLVMGSLVGGRGGAVGEPEAVAVHGLDERRVADLAAQRREVHVEYLGRPVPVLVPGPLHDLLPADEPAGVDGQALEYRELLGGERHLGAGHGHLPGAQA